MSDIEDSRMPKWMDESKLKKLKADPAKPEEKIPLGNHLIAGALVVFVGVIVLWNLFPPPSTPNIKSVSAAQGRASIAELDAAIAKGAVAPMDRHNFPKFYSALGKKRFDEANALAIWAARAAAESADCGEVSYVAQSDSTTKKKLVWFANCGSGERLTISEDQARATRARLDPAAPASDKRFASAQPAQSEASRIAARFEGFDEVVAETLLCQEAVKATAVNRGSVDFAWTGEKAFDADTGIVTFQRDFDAANSFGGQISSRYHCEVNADQKRIAKLMIRELDGWRVLVGG